MRKLLFVVGILWACVAAQFASAAVPSVIQYAESTFNDSGATDETSASITWLTGDRIYVFAGASNNQTNPTFSTPTATGLTFSPLADVNNTTGGGNDTVVMLFGATAGSGGSSAVTCVTNTGAATQRSGISVFVVRDATSEGTPATQDGLSSKTINLTRTGTNSIVLGMLVDFNQVGDVVVDATPTGTVRHATAETGEADFFVLSWGDQGAAGGPTAYGLTNHTGTVDMSGAVIEIIGSGGGSAATLSAATPSGTLGTSTTATLGATTDTTSGTFYGVVDPSGSISGITAAQVKAAQDNGGGAVVASCNNTVSGTSPTCGVTGLAASTAYGYAVVQNSAGGDSNVLTGTFTTAAASGSKVVLKRRRH